MLRRGLVSCEWLATNIQGKKIKVVDASWYLPAMNRNNKLEFQQKRINGAQFFDIDDIKDHRTNLPHMLPTQEEFANKVAALGINLYDDFVVAYDGTGIFSAPRAYWMFQYFGHDQCAVLNGGFPLFQSLYPNLVDTSEPIPPTPAPLPSELRPPRSELLKSAKDVQEIIQYESHTIVDARPAGRFDGSEPEPRPNIRSGHVPGAHNIFFKDVIAADGTLKEVETVQSVFRGAGIDILDNSKPAIVSMCGSGVTACILHLAMDASGVQRATSVYDGSWSEWASDPVLPRVPIDGALLPQ